MLNRDVLYGRNRSSNLLLWVGATLMISLVSFAAGLWLGNEVLSSPENELSALRTNIENLQTAVRDADLKSQTLNQDLTAATQSENNLRMQLAEAEGKVSIALQSANEKESEKESESDSTQDENANLQEQIILSLETRIAQISNEKDNIESLRAMTDDVEKHRLLLVEMRKEAPQTREESSKYWKSIKSLASKADPSLASPVDKVILRIDNYFDWNDRAPDANVRPEDHLAWLAEYSTSGAVTYEEASYNFTKEALLAVIIQMDSIITRLN